MTVDRPFFVLVVDDDRDVVGSAVELLRDRGFHAAGTANAIEALLLATDDPPDVVLVDLTMPEMSGGDFAVRLRRTLSHSPFLIVMTAPGEEVGELLAVETGFHLWLTKPIDPENLLSILDICRQARDRLESPEVAGEIIH